MSKSTNLHDKNLKARLQRLLSGDFQVDDIAKLYVGKRSNSFGCASFKELADFVAHPDKRSRGPVSDRIRDMRTTFKPLFDRLLKEGGASLEDIIARSESNFRMASDEQIAKLTGGRKRQQVRRDLRSAVEKMKKGQFDTLSPDERVVAINFGDRLIWNPALRAQEVFDDFKYVLIKNGLLTKAESKKLDDARPLVVLHAITVMHGAAFDLGNGVVGELQAGFDNQEGFLEITASLKLEGYPKSISMKVGLFWTDLLGRDHVEITLSDRPGPWGFAIEIKDGRIAPIGFVVPKEETSVSTMVIKIK